MPRKAIAMTAQEKHALRMLWQKVHPRIEEELRASAAASLESGDDKDQPGDRAAKEAQRC